MLCLNSLKYSQKPVDNKEELNNGSRWCAHPDDPIGVLVHRKGTLRHWRANLETG